jgi:uncharacterized protein (DUF342 family)
LYEFKNLNVLLFSVAGEKSALFPVFSAVFSVSVLSGLRQVVLHIAGQEPDLLCVASDVPEKDAALLLKMLTRHRPGLKIIRLAVEQSPMEINPEFSIMEKTGVKFLFGDFPPDRLLGIVMSLLGCKEIFSEDAVSLNPENIAGDDELSFSEELVSTRHFQGLPEFLEQKNDKEQNTVALFSASDFLSGYSRERRPSEPFISIVVSPDFLTARLICYPADYLQTMELVKSELVKSNVFFGIDERKIEMLLSRVNRDREPVLGAVVANGVPAVDGIDARIDYNFRLPDEICVKENEAGRVDYKAIREIPNVRKDDLLAVVTPPVPPKSGCGVDGRKLNGKPGRPSLMLPGRGVRYNKEEGRFYAEIDGYATLVGKRIQVIPLYTVPCDVDYSTGNIDFVGTVVVNGNISAGFSVRAEGDVIVQGVIEASACVYAGGNIVAKGVIGGEQGLLEAKGMVRIGWCQEAVIKADGDVHVTDAVLNSHISSLGNIYVQEKKGVIIGGLVRGVQGVRVKTIGSRLEVPTMVVAGENFRMMELVGELNRLQKINSQNQTKISLGLKAAGLQASQDPVRREKMRKLTEISADLAEKERDFELKKQELMRRMAERSFAKIQVKEAVFGNTKIQIGASVCKITEMLCNCSFYDDGVSVRVGMYESG